MSSLFPKERGVNRYGHTSILKLVLNIAYSTTYIFTIHSFRDSISCLLFERSSKLWARKRIPSSSTYDTDIRKMIDTKKLIPEN